MPRISYSFKTFLRIKKKKAIHHIYFQSCNYKHESFNIQIEWKPLPQSSHPNIRFVWNSLKGVHLTCTDSYVVIHKLLTGFSWKTDKSLTHYGAKNDLELLFPPASKWNSSVEFQAWDPLLIFSFSSLTLSLLPLLKEGYRPGCTGTHYRPRVKSPPDHAFWIPWLKVFATTSTQCFCHRLSLSS